MTSIATAADNIALPETATAPQLGSEADARNERADAEHQLSPEIMNQDTGSYAGNYQPPADAVGSVPSLDKASVAGVIARLRALHASHVKDNAAEQKELDKTVQERLRSFLTEGYEQAVELMRDENRTVLIDMLREHDIAPGNSTTKLMQQIAFVQMAQQKKDKSWTVPARRHERIGNLYRIFHDKGWSAVGLGQRIIDAGGTTKIIDKDKKDRADPQIAEKQARRAATVHGDHHGSALASLPGVTPQNSGGWRLALVSVHDGEVRVRTLVGTRNDTATLRERDAYCAANFADCEARKLAATEQADA